MRYFTTRPVVITSDNSKINEICWADLKCRKNNESEPNLKKNSEHPNAKKIFYIVLTLCSKLRKPAKI